MDAYEEGLKDESKWKGVIKVSLRRCHNRVPRHLREKFRCSLIPLTLVVMCLSPDAPLSLLLSPSLSSFLPSFSSLPPSIPLHTGKGG